LLVAYAKHVLLFLYMTKVIQIRNVPDELHRKLKVRAAQEGMTLSDYLLSEVAQVAERPTLRELMERLRQREPVRSGRAARGHHPPDAGRRRPARFG